MMQTKLATLVFMSIACGLPEAHAAGTSSGPDTLQPPLLHRNNFKSRRITSPSQPPSNHAGALLKSAAPEGDREAPAVHSLG